MKRPLNILVLLLICPIILFTIFYYSSLYGNPITRIKATLKIEEYAKKEFNEENYILDDIQYDPKLNLYYRKLDVINSEDKDFNINYKNNEIFDDREMVSEGINTCNRIQSLLNDPKYEEPIKEIFKDNYNFSLLTLDDEDWKNVKLDISLNDFLKEYKLNLHIYLNNNIENNYEFKHNIIKEYKKLGIKIKNIEFN